MLRLGIWPSRGENTKKVSDYYLIGALKLPSKEFRSI